MSNRTPWFETDHSQAVVFILLAIAAVLFAIALWNS